MDYEKMLNTGKENLPEASKLNQRFEIPKVKGHIQGNRTVINNFNVIAQTLERNASHILKFILKELAAKGKITKNALIIGAKIPASRINEKIQAYADIFVICKECGKPDTEFKKENGVMHLKCHACGAKYPINTKI